MPKGVYQRKYKPAAERFLKHVKPGPDGCLLWTGAKIKGYGHFMADGKFMLAHRWNYELHKGPIPEGLVLDHLCRTPACVNPDHLEAVSQRENIMRGTGYSARHARLTHCPKDHPYDETNTNFTKWGRICRTCRKDYMRRLYLSKKQG